MEHLLLFHLLGTIIPTEELIFFRGVGIAPTRCTLITLFSCTLTLAHQIYPGRRKLDPARLMAEALAQSLLEAPFVGRVGRVAVDGSKSIHAVAGNEHPFDNCDTLW